MGFEFGTSVIPGAYVFFESRAVVCFVSRFAVVAGHVVVCTRSRVERFSSLMGDDIADLWRVAVRVAHAAAQLESVRAVSDTNYVVQEGVVAGQRVPHVHIHVLPRRPGDFEENDHIYRVLEGGTPGGRTARELSHAEIVAQAAQLRISMGGSRTINRGDS
uniref:HIT domain-containing protein n=1 Tax=Compsopogon caeruleus TaxID=31354 RepID=A0A7S1XCY3_9RHOD|mmetsp:Transcript_13708/g.28127  ORF Transcript_13708/g.28127 Transcript_13708/m.28127 type:complete len:161 (+) Transcript_13708:91-573(+)